MEWGGVGRGGEKWEGKGGVEKGGGGERKGYRSHHTQDKLS